MKPADLQGNPALNRLAYDPSATAVEGENGVNSSDPDSTLNIPVGRDLSETWITPPEGALSTTATQAVPTDETRSAPVPPKLDPGQTIELPAGTPPSLDVTFVTPTTGPADPDQTYLLDPPPFTAGGYNGVTVAGYEVHGELGRGAMGVVYKARQVCLNRVVALKMVLAGAHAGPEFLARFAIEAQAVAQLQHPNIVQIYEVGESDGLPYFSLEFVDGGSLAQRIGGKPMPPRESAHVAELLAAAMASAHRHGVVHRDLKPANVLLTTDGMPKISDFGLAKRLDEDSGQTKSGTLMGTPSYMSPEQASGDTHAIGPLADVYALGVILYEMLTGRTPYVGVSILDTLQLIRSQEPLPPGRLVPKIPQDLETICLKCLQKEQAKRYAGADELAADLHRFLDGEPIKARPVGPAERAWRWCRRNPLIAGLYGTIGSLVVVVGVFFSVMAVRSARERETTADARRATEQRLEQATVAVRAGRHRQAQVVLGWSDPLVESSPALADARSRLQRLRDQVALYGEFKEHLDKVRFQALFGSKGGRVDVRALCHSLIDLYDEVAQGAGRGACGMPPLDEAQEQLLKEDYFDAFLIAAQVEWDTAGPKADAAARQAAADKAMPFLERANAVYPGTWVYHQRRRAFFESLGDTTNAAVEMQHMAKLRPTSPLDRFWYGFALHTQGDSLKNREAAQANYRQAIQEYSNLLRLRPDHFWAYFEGATCHFQLGQLPEAVVGFTVCVQLRPEAAWPYFNRGTLLIQQQQFAAAVEDLTAALQRSPDGADAYVNRGLAHAGLEKWDAALADYDRALAVDPNSATGYLHRAELYRRLNRLPDALADFARAQKLDDKNPLLYLNRGSAYLAAQDFKNAQADFAVLTAVAPDDPGARRLFGFSSLRLYDFANAHRGWAALGKLMPKSPEPLHNAAITYKAERRYDEAIKALTDAVQLQPGEATSYLFRAQVYHMVGRLKEAEDDLKYVLNTLKQRKGETLNDYGDLLRTSGRADEAVAAYEESIKLLPKQTDAFVGIALVHQLNGKPAAAEAALDRMVAAMPESARAYVRRAEFFRNCGRWEEAQNACEKAEKLDGKSPIPPLVKASNRAARGEFREGVRDAEAVLRAAPPEGNTYYTAACVWSLAAATAEAKGEAGLAKQYADRSAAILADTLGKTFLDLNFQAVNRIVAEPALAVARRQPATRDLLPALKRKGG